MSNYFDDTKKFLELSRNLRTKRINESDEQTMFLSDNEYKSEQSKFKSAVGGQVKFLDFKIYKTGNIEFRGQLLTEGIEWTFSMDDTEGCYIHSKTFLQLRDETLDVLNKLKGYYMVWRKDWVDKVNEFTN